ncbi:MAG: hypothetical protein AAFX87_10980 [Bacteroidota bacterium]
MKIVLSESLDYHVSELDNLSLHYDVDPDWKTRYLDESTENWKRVKFAASLMANEISIYSPASEKALRFDIGFYQFLAAVRTNYNLLNDRDLRVFIQSMPDRRRGYLVKGKYVNKASPYNLDVEYQSVKEAMAVIAPDINDDHIFVSNDPILNKLYWNNLKSITPENLLIFLAMSGINFMLPNIYSEDHEVILEIRDRFKSERLEYVSWLRQFLGDCYVSLKDGSYEDYNHYVSFTLGQSLKSSLDKFELAIQNSGLKFLKRLKSGVVDGVPSIGYAILDPNKSWSLELIKQFLKIISGELNRKILISEAREAYPHVSFIHEIKKRLS